jgi:hypothetical protein
MASFDGLGVLITGAATGLGAATALGFARQGARVIINYACEDTGSAIKGENRLDFYTGSYGLKSKANIFGSTASDLFKMFGNKSCHPNKTFRAIRHSDPEWQTAAGAIAAAIQRGLATSSKSSWLTEAAP